MAITKGSSGWTLSTLDPNNAPVTIDAGSDRVQVFAWAYKLVADNSMPTSFFIGGQTATGFVTWDSAEVGNALECTMIGWWDETKIAAMSGSSFTFSGGSGSRSFDNYGYVTLLGVDQSTPVYDQDTARVVDSAANTIATSNMTSDGLAFGVAINGISNDRQHSWSSGWTELQERLSGNNTWSSSLADALNLSNVNADPTVTFNNTAQDRVLNVVSFREKVTAQTVTITLKDLTGTVLRTNLTNLKWAWFDSMPTDLSAPVDYGTVETTDASAVLALTLNSTTLTSGQFGYLSLEDTANGHYGFYRLSID